ncbi:MFS transporter [Actinokineospora sp. NPDC004072]
MSARLRVTAAYGLATCGTFGNLVVLGVAAHQVTGTGTGVGLLLAVRLAAAGIGGLVAGALAARLDRARLMTAAAAVQAAAAGAAALAGNPPGVAVLVAAVAVLGVSGSLFLVSLRSSIPELVEAGERVRANSGLVMAKSVGMVAGLAVAGPAAALGGLPAAFALIACCYALAAVAAAVRLPRRADAEAPAAHQGSAVGPGGRRVLMGAGSAVLAVVALRGVDALASASHNVVLPVVADGDAGFVARFWLAWAAGVLVAQQVGRRWGGLAEPARAQRVFALATGAMAAAFAVAFTGLPPAALVGVVVLAGIADGIGEIAYTSRLQELREPARARLFGLSASVETSGLAAGMVACGLVTDVLPAAAVVAAFHGVALCAAAGFLVNTAVRSRGRRERRGLGRADADHDLLHRP